MKRQKQINTNTSTLGGRIGMSMIGAEKTVGDIAIVLKVDIKTVRAWLEDKANPTDAQLDILSVLFKIPFGDDWLKTGKHSNGQ